ncbi:hypothetical protein VSDG_07159 [Cytospora chrysosperma]|uniref:AB hydrolase-1 domain-containing protein n=1 Tax=Cytospora chrysosperma TaxID=252740 RepID=A0A423VKF3_CYTCH|nr:hypothetical protein VSDG_07159 [Valsa sordida]
MSLPTKPTVVLLQGTFQLPEVYHKLAGLIESRGFPVVQPSFPSLMDQDDPDFTKRTLADDAEAVEAVIKKLVAGEGRTVLALMHSYGGLGPQGARPPGGVARLLYCTAFVLPRGQSVATAVGDSADHDHWDGRFKMRVPLTTMYNDLPADEAAYWAERVIAQSGAVKETAVERCAYTYLPSTYVVCMGDKAVPPQVQEMFARLAGSEVRRIESGHSPMLSRPDEVATLVEEAAVAT